MDARTRRRRATLAVFDGLLDEADLIDALWLSQTALASDSVTDIIRFIDQLAGRHGIEPATCKRLYQALHGAMRRSDAELPLDPWPLMAAARPAAAGAPSRTPWPAAPAMPASFAGTPAMHAPYAAAAAVLAPAPLPPADPAPVAAEPPAAADSTEAPPPAVADWQPDSGVPAEQAVFAELLAALSAHLAQLHPTRHADWRDACRTQLLTARKLEAAQQHALGAALASLQPDTPAAALRQAWRLALPAPALAEHLTLVYVALCEALGPVHADQVLGLAVRQAEQHPAARVFPPRRLL